MNSFVKEGLDAPSLRRVAPRGARGPTSAVAFFRDFDGTLVDIAPTPDAVVVPASVPDILGELGERTGGAVAILTGRPLGDVDRRLAPLALPGCGQHGLQLRLPGGGAVSRDPGEMEPIRRRLAALVPDWPEGIEIEDKGLAIAVHFRAHPEAGREIERAVGTLVAETPEVFRLRRGKMVIEATLAGASKGTALRRLMIEPPFLGRTPIVIGDDVTDDDAFEAARGFGGMSFQVGSRDGHRADFEIGGPADVVRLLGDFAADFDLGRKSA